jgi:HTH-type transcriptional regulator/antitoxin HigA
MNIKPIKTKRDYKLALARIDELFDVEDNSPESDELEVLITLVHDYEDKHYQIMPPDPIEAIIYVMEKSNMKHKDLVPYIGNPGLISQVLNRKRNLSLSMIRKLHKAFSIPLEVLIRESKCL